MLMASKHVLYDSGGLWQNDDSRKKSNTTIYIFILAIKYIFASQITIIKSAVYWTHAVLLKYHLSYLRFLLDQIVFKKLKLITRRFDRYIWVYEMRASKILRYLNCNAIPDN